MSKINLVKKISVAKLIGGKPKLAEIIAFFANPENVSKTDMPLCRFFGSASGTKTGATDFGEWTALTGQFRGVNLTTGETMDSGVCFLPDVAHDLIAGALNGGNNSVDFAFDISVRQDDKSATGYIYTASPVLQEENNPIARLEAKLAQLALPAPEGDKEPTKVKGK